MCKLPEQLSQCKEEKKMVQNQTSFLMEQFKVINNFILFKLESKIESCEQRLQSLDRDNKALEKFCNELQAVCINYCI
jgi:hypothetical protein